MVEKMFISTVEIAAERCESAVEFCLFQLRHELKISNRFKLSGLRTDTANRLASDFSFDQTISANCA